MSAHESRTRIEDEITGAGPAFGPAFAQMING